MQDTCFFFSLCIFHALITNLHNNISDEYQEMSILTIKTNQKFVKNNTSENCFKKLKKKPPDEDWDHLHP
jgi:hypothetical protein